MFILFRCTSDLLMKKICFKRSARFAGLDNVRVCLCACVSHFVWVCYNQTSLLMMFATRGSALHTTLYPHRAEKRHCLNVSIKKRRLYFSGQLKFSALWSITWVYIYKKRMNVTLNIWDVWSISQLKKHWHTLFKMKVLKSFFFCSNPISFFCSPKKLSVKDS